LKGVLFDPCNTPDYLTVKTTACMNGIFLNVVNNHNLDPAAIFIRLSNNPTCFPDSVSAFSREVFGVGEKRRRAAEIGVGQGC
jgi:hypothetical protein